MLFIGKAPFDADRVTREVPAAIDPLMNRSIEGKGEGMPCAC